MGSMCLWVNTMVVLTTLLQHTCMTSVGGCAVPSGTSSVFQPFPARRDKEAGNSGAYYPQNA